MAAQSEDDAPIREPFVFGQQEDDLDLKGACAPRQNSLAAASSPRGISRVANLRAFRRFDVA
jgi:hypothetical protein